MADGEQRGSREERKPKKKEKPKEAPSGSSYKAQFGKPAGKRK